VVSIFIHLIQCTTSKLFRCGIVGGWADSLLSIILCIWWSVGCGVISIGVGKASGRNLPAGNWRTATLVMFWVEFLLFLLIAISGAVRNAMRGMVVEKVEHV